MIKVSTLEKFLSQTGDIIFTASLQHPLLSTMDYKHDPNMTGKKNHPRTKKEFHTGWADR